MIRELLLLRIEYCVVHMDEWTQNSEVEDWQTRVYWKSSRVVRSM